MTQSGDHLANEIISKKTYQKNNKYDAAWDLYQMHTGQEESDFSTSTIVFS